MRYSADFLDEIRAHVSVSEVVSKRTPLVRQGRSFRALCPFHNDTKPSLNIVDSKNFYHCFACGASGDIFAFVMGTENIGFYDSVVRLAELAGIELPQRSPEERQRTERRKTLLEVVEIACSHFEHALRGSEGARCLDYLHGRGLSDDTIGRFRLGFASEKSKTLRQAMSVRGIGDEALLEVGLIRQSDDQRPPYDYFRDRVIFPITDRQGRVIAFGGRMLGDRQPKYLNSPDTPLFHKGRVLYGHYQAGEVAVKAGEVIVVEGYMDVIALAQGGLPQAVAPLGTALTEDQIKALWRLAPEPVICFDGDDAGRRAAVRASERALSVLQPGCSLRFASLPSGQDPDDLIGREGNAAMRNLLDGATGLADFLWDIELQVQPVTTPERMADFVRRIRNRVGEIADRTVQNAYRDVMEARLRELRAIRYGSGPTRYSGPSKIAPRASAAARARVSRVLQQRQDECVIAAILNHPELLEEFGEALGSCQFEDPFLDKLRQDILDKAFSEPGLDAAAFQDHLRSLGYDEECGGILGSETLRHAAFARVGASLSDARVGFCELLARVRKHHLESQLLDATEAFRAVGSEVNWNRVTALSQMLTEINAGSAADDAG